MTTIKEVNCNPLSQILYKYPTLTQHFYYQLFILFTEHFVTLFKFMSAQKGVKRKRTAVSLETKLEILKE